MKAIRNAKIILENEVINDGVILIDGDRISDFGSASKLEIPGTAQVIDASGLYVGPGFVDIHVHAYDGEYIYKEPDRTASFSLKHGHTTILSAFYDDMTCDEMLESYNRIIRTIQKGGPAKIIKGIYMEGPYMNTKYGAIAYKKNWDDNKIESKDYCELVETLGDFAKVWVIAPERDGMVAFLKKVLEVNPKAVISVGHSEATVSQIDKLKQYNICLLTHCTNATGRVGEGDGVRRCGPDEYCFLNDDMYAEIISDSKGIHVEADMIKLILKIKGRDRIILISDSSASNSENPECYSHITDLRFDESGLISGSKLTLDIACANMIKHSGCSINDVFVMASRNPSRLIGMDSDIGSIAVGKKANLVFVDENISVKKVMLEGDLMEV